MSSSLTDQPAVKQLIETFDLVKPESYRIVVTEWSATDGKEIGTKPFIIITAADVYNTKNEFIKTADLKLLKDSIQNFSVIFQKQK